MVRMKEMDAVKKLDLLSDSLSDYGDQVDKMRAQIAHLLKCQLDLWALVRWMDEPFRKDASRAGFLTEAGNAAAERFQELVTEMVESSEEMGKIADKRKDDIRHLRAALAEGVADHRDMGGSPNDRWYLWAKELLDETP